GDPAGWRVPHPCPARLPLPARPGGGPPGGRAAYRPGIGARGPRPGAPAAAALFRAGLRAGFPRLLEPHGLRRTPARPGACRAPAQLPGARHLHGAPAAMIDSPAKHMVTSPSSSAVEPRRRLRDTARRLFFFERDRLVAYPHLT